MQTISGVSLQERDFDLLRSLFESRVMTSAHIATLFFEGSREAAKKRLLKLKKTGLLSERARRIYEPSVVSLTSKALLLLQQQGVLAEYPVFPLSSFDKRARVSELTLGHELEVMDVKAALCAAVRSTDRFTVAEFSTWPLLYQFEAFRTRRGSAEVTVKPDGFIRIHEKEADGGLSEQTFFLEVDRSSETQDTLVTRAGCYMDYFKSGGFAARNGAPRAAFKDFPFRVLIVCKSAERRNNTAERLLQNTPPIFTQVWLTTMRESVSDPFGAIWIRPIDYQNATHGTRFDPAGRRQSWQYARQTDREHLVATRVKKCRLLDEPS